MAFSQQEYWSGLPCPPPGYLPKPGIEPRSPTMQADSLLSALWTGSKLGKEYNKAACCHPTYLAYIQSTSHEMLGWKKHKLESRLLGAISITSDMLMTPPLWQKWRKEPLDEGERREWKIWLKTQHDHGIQSHHFKANRWGKEEAVTHSIFLGSKITADGDCSHKLKDIYSLEGNYDQLW